jgi:hypothetical protein
MNSMIGDDWRIGHDWRCPPSASRDRLLPELLDRYGKIYVILEDFLGSTLEAGVCQSGLNQALKPVTTLEPSVRVGVY